MGLICLTCPWPPHLPFSELAGLHQERAPIGFHRVVEILHKNSAPVQVMVSRESSTGSSRETWLSASFCLAMGDFGLLWSYLKGNIMVVLHLDLERARKEFSAQPLEVWPQTHPLWGVYAVFSQREAHYSNDTGELNEKGHQGAGGTGKVRPRAYLLLAPGVWLRMRRSGPFSSFFGRTWITESPPHCPLQTWSCGSWWEL